LFFYFFFDRINIIFIIYVENPNRVGNPVRVPGRVPEKKQSYFLLGTYLKFP
jgi:hypothetical protein